MTFLSVVFAILISGSSASMPLKAQTLTGTSIRDTAQQRKIMEKAFRVNRQGERILGNNNNNNGLSGQYSIEFDTCVALSTEPDDDGQFIFDASLLSSTLNKTIVPQVSYVVFSACKTQYCDYYEQKNKDLYMIDLATYMDALAEFYTERQETYCEACMDSYSYCQ